MTDKKEGKNDPSSIVSLATGAAIGAGAALVGVALSDKKNRKKIKESVDKISAKTDEVVKDAKDKGKEVKKDVQEKLDDEEGREGRA